MAGFEEVPRRTGARSGGQLKVTKFSPHAFHLEEKIADSAAEGSPKAGSMHQTSGQQITSKAQALSCQFMLLPSQSTGDETGNSEKAPETGN